MAAIKYDELFDFPGYTKAIKDAESANKDFGKTVSGIVDRLTKQYEGMKQELGEFTGILKAFNLNQKGAGDTLIRTGDAAVAAAKKIREQKAVIQELLSVQDLSTRSVKELKSGLTQLKAEYEAIAGKSDDARAKKSALAAEARRVKAAIKEETDVLNATSKVLKAAEGSYDALQREMAAIGKQLKAMPDAFDKTTGRINNNNKEALALQKRYLELNTTLKAADATMGNYQRNVGNYSSAFRGLNASVGQVTRELPALGINAQTFFLAISNNLPILFDSLRDIKGEVAALRAEGIKTPGVFQQFAKALFSVGTLLSVGVTLLTLYGHKVAEFIGGLFRAKSSLTEFQKAQQLSNEITEKGIKTFASEASHLEVVRRKLTDLTIPAAERVKIAKEYNETAEKANQIDLKQIDNLGAINNKIASQIALIKQRGLARAAENLIAERAEALLLAEESARENALKVQATIDATAVEGTRTIRTPDGKLLKIGVTETERELNRQKAIADRIAKDPKVVKAKQELDRALQVGLAKISPTSLAGSDANDKDKKDKDLIKEQQDNLKKLANLAVQELELQLSKELISEEEFQIKKLDIIAKYVDAAVELENSRGAKASKGVIADLNKEKIQAETEYNKFIRKQAEDNKKEDLERAKDSIEQEANFKISALKDEQLEVLAAKKLTDVQREALEIHYQNRIDEILIDALTRRAELETDAAKKSALLLKIEELRRSIVSRNAAFEEKTLRDSYQRRIDAENRAFDLIAAARDVSFRDQIEHLKRLEAIEKEFAARGVDITKDAEKRKYEEKVLFAEKERALREEMEATLIDVIDTGLQIAQNLATAAFERRIADLEAEREQELAAAGNNAVAREQIEAKYNKKVAEQKRKQAVADKNFALFQVAISTAQGVAKTISEWGMPFAIPFIALTLVQGALQAALIASRPIPKFKHGTDYSPEGPAIVDEEGPELIIDRQGRLREIGGDDGPRLTYLERGSKVIPHGRSRQMMKDLQMQDIKQHSEVIRTMTHRFQEGKSEEMVYAMTRALQSGAINEHAIAAAFEKAVKKVPKSDFFLDEKGFRKRVTEKGDRTTYLNNLTRM